MKKLVVFLCTMLISGSSFSQIAKNQPGFYGKLSKQIEMSFPGINNNLLNFRNQNHSSQQQAYLKEANTLKQRLDSVVSPGFDKDVYMYDASGNVLRDIYFEWDGQWSYSRKEDYDYDSNGNLTLTIENEWDGTQWVYLWKNETSYDANRNQLQNVNYNWNGDQWINASKEESVYDSFGNQTKIINYNGTGLADGLWMENRKNEYLFDTDGNMIQDIEYAWDGMLWNKVMKTEYAFDTSGKMVVNTIDEWLENDWVKSAKFEPVYNENGLISQSLGYSWDVDQWVNESKFEYSYDANQNLILFDIYYSDFNFMKMESVYDDSGNRTLYSIYILDFETFQLSPQLKQEYVFDNNFSFENLILPFSSVDFESDMEGLPLLEISEMFKHKVVHLTDYIGEAGSWMMQGDYSLYYSEQNITGVKDLNTANKVSVYPNPATDRISFKIDDSGSQFTVELYDIQGKIVMSQLSESNRPVSIEALHKGLYFYRISENLNSYTGKFMVK